MKLLEYFERKLKRSDHRVGMLLCAFVALTLLPLPAMGDIYFWRDSEGVLHFSNQQVPPEAELYMAAPPPRPETVVATAPAALPEPSAAERADRLAEADRRLGEALEKVDALTDEVEQTRREARAAAESARDAAETAAREREARERAEAASSYPAAVIVGVPGSPPKKRQGPYPEPAYWRHDTRRYPYYDGDRRRDGPRRSSDAAGPTDFDARFRQPSDFNQRFRSPSDFNEQFRQPSGFERQFIQRQPDAKSVPRQPTRPTR